MTYVAWVSPTSTHTGHVMGIGDQANVGHNMLYLSNTGYNRAYSRALSPAVAAFATASSSYATSSWQHMAAVYESSVSRTVYLDGGSAVTNTTAVVFDPGQDVFSLGTRWWNGTVDLPLNAKVGEAAIYSIALTVAEMGLLATGFSPMLVRPESLVAYYPLLHDYNDWGPGGFHLTKSTNPAILSPDHPPIIHAAPAIFIPRFTSGVEESRDITLPGMGGFDVEPVAASIYNLGILMEPLPVAVFPHPDKSIDDDYDSQFASIKAYETLDKLLSTGTEDGEDTFVRETENGLLRSQFEEQFWFDRVHLLPRVVQELGNIVSTTVIDAELYNSDMEDTITISSVTNNLGSGVTIAGVPATPFNLGPRENIEVEVTISATGGLTVDSEYIFHQDTGDIYTLFITGSRIVLFPIRPEAPLREHLIWETKILTTVTGDEQRIANRDVPRGEFEFTIKDDIKQAEMILFDRQSKMLAVPSWHEPSFLTSDASISDVTINVNETRYSDLFVDGYVIIFHDIHTYDTLKILSLTNTTITFDAGLTVAFDSNTQVMPLKIAWMEVTSPVVKAVYNDQTISLKVKVPATDEDIADASAFSTYNGKVFLDDPNYLPNKQLQEALRTKVYVLDNGTGDRSQFSLWQRAIRNSGKGFKTNNRQELWELRQLLHFLTGQQVSFYIPSFTKDLVPSSTLVVTNSTFTMANIGYTNNVNNRWPKKVFRIHLLDGTILTRTIVDSSIVSASVEQLTIDVVWPYNIEPEDIERVEFLTKVRFAVDDIVITHNNALGWSECVIPTVEVTDDDV